MPFVVGSSPDANVDGEVCLNPLTRSHCPLHPCDALGHPQQLPERGCLVSLHRPLDTPVACDWSLGQIGRDGR